MKPKYAWITFFPLETQKKRTYTGKNTRLYTVKQIEVIIATELVLIYSFWPKAKAFKKSKHR